MSRAIDRLANAVPKFACPACGEYGSRVTNSRPALDRHDIDAYRRRRQCLWCGARFNTIEFIEAQPPIEKSL